MRFRELLTNWWKPGGERISKLFYETAKNKNNRKIKRIKVVKHVLVSSQWFKEQYSFVVLVHRWGYNVPHLQTVKKSHSLASRAFWWLCDIVILNTVLIKYWQSKIASRAFRWLLDMGNQLSTWNLSIQSAVDGHNYNYNKDYNQVLQKAK